MNENAVRKRALAEEQLTAVARACLDTICDRARGEHRSIDGGAPCRDLRPEQIAADYRFWPPTMLW
jgi:hypothetical protein